ncbi:MAG TPA: hypothetical protein VFZ08_03755 [Terriglobia bacterium]|nr:hypothetical protein [Terriglobia bacterium]
MPALASSKTVSTETIHRGCITGIRPTKDGAAECVLSQGAAVLLSAFLATHLASGDQVEAPIAPNQAGVEIHVLKNPSSRRMRELYQAPIGYATQPKEDKRKELFVTAGVTGSRLGIASIQLPCHVLRDYFYVADRQREWGKQPTLYEIVRMPQYADPGQLRLSFKIRQLELQKEGAPKSAYKALERAYNILAHPELRACYDALLKDREAPALFPYGGFGSLLVSGDRSRDGQTFFVRRLLAFRPELRERRFHAPLRKFDFYPTTALYRDARRKLEVLVDQCVMPVVWNATWNQWRHLVAAKVEIQGTFVRAGKYRMQSGKWCLIEWESALPSRLNIKLPANLQEQLVAARKAYHRFGQYSRMLDQIRARIERGPVEKRELERMLGQLGVPGDFDVAQLTWRPDYDPFFYRQLCQRARRLYLFHNEYIFDAGAVAVETPQLGHATYLFARPASMEIFLALYAKTSKEAIRENRDNIAARLGFLGRIVHGVHPRAWVKELNARIGESVDLLQ